jgi:hypothetical protein
VVPLDVDGSAITASTDEPEQDVYASFAGTAGARVALEISNVTFLTWTRITVHDPDGSTLFEQWVGTGAVPAQGWIEFELRAAGVYTVFVDVQPFDSGGSVTLQIVTRPPDLAAVIEAGRSD